MNDESMTQTRATDDVASTSSHQHPKSQSNLHVQTTERKTKNNGAYDSNREASEDLNHEAGDVRRNVNSFVRSFALHSLLSWFLLCLCGIDAAGNQNKLN